MQSNSKTSQEANNKKVGQEPPVCEATSPDIGILEPTVWPVTVTQLKLARSEEIPGPHRFAKLMNIDEKL